MDKVMASELGSLGINVDQSLTTDYIQTELIDKAQKGDRTSVFKMQNIVRHYAGENAEAIKEFVKNALIRLGELDAPVTQQETTPTNSETPKENQPETPKENQPETPSENQSENQSETQPETPGENTEPANP